MHKQFMRPHIVFSIAAIAFTLLALQLFAAPANSASPSALSTVTVGSKTFPESYVLAEITAQLLESHGLKVERKVGLGGTLIAFEALQTGAIDVYPEYTGTLSQAVLQKPDLSAAQLQAELARLDLDARIALGFSNSYAITIAGAVAEKLGISNISDLASHPELNVGLSLEFLNRADGWPALKLAYQLPHSPSGIEHALAYRAVDGGQLDFTDAYTTDGELDNFDLVMLHDDRGFFPNYDAVLLSRTDLPQAATTALLQLHDAIDEAKMRQLNRRLSQEKLSPSEVAAQFLHESGMANAHNRSTPTMLSRVMGYTVEHLKLTLTALLLASAIAIPLSLLVARYRRLARGLLYLTGLLQTIPALALLALLVPLVGLGQVPAIIALFLYSLLPIVRNTLTGLFSVDPLLKDVATGMGLTPRQQLWKIELPLAAPTILAGVKTAAIISMGTATLAAFVGAGGLGEPIITGLTLNDHRLILEGAIPAAMLAITVELVFEAVERFAIPAHLRA